VSRAKARAAQAAGQLKKAVGLAKKVRRVLAAEAAQAQARLVLAKEF